MRHVARHLQRRVGQSVGERATSPLARPSAKPMPPPTARPAIARRKLTPTLRANSPRGQPRGRRRARRAAKAEQIAPPAERGAACQATSTPAAAPRRAPADQAFRQPGEVDATASRRKSERADCRAVGLASAHVVLAVCGAAMAQVLGFQGQTMSRTRIGAGIRPRRWKRSATACCSASTLSVIGPKLNSARSTARFCAAMIDAARLGVERRGSSRCFSGHFVALTTSSLISPTRSGVCFEKSRLARKNLFWRRLWIDRQRPGVLLQFRDREERIPDRPRVDRAARKRRRASAGAR